MGIWGHKVPTYHHELFGDDEPHSLYFIIMKMTDFWEMHPLRPEFTTLFSMLELLAPEKQEKLKRYVYEIPWENLEDVAPGWHFIPGIHRSAKLVEYLKRDGKIKVPAVVYFGKNLRKDQWKNGYVYEGHHRAGAAAVLKWPTIPALVLHTVEVLRVPSLAGMTDDERDQMGQEQRKRGFPDSSRIHGLTLQYWTEKELRTFMRPRPNDKLQYFTQNKYPITRNCTIDHPDWEGIPRGIVIKNKRGEFPLPWDRDIENHSQSTPTKNG